MPAELLVATAADVVTAPPAPAGKSLDQLAQEWLVACGAGSKHTFRAYRRLITDWLAYCITNDLDPLRVTRADTDLWHRGYALVPSQRTGRTPSQATLATVVSVVSSFYRFLADDEEILASVPIRKRSRPRAPTTSPTVAMDAAEAARFHVRLELQVEQARTVAVVDPAVGAAMVTAALVDRAALLTLLLQAVRISELLTLTVGSLVHNAGEPTMVVHGKRGKVRTIAVAAPAHLALTELIADRFGETRPAPDTPVFPMPANDAARLQVTRAIKRVARAAGISSHQALSPHGLRHTCVTLMLSRGIQTSVVQDFAGHASGDTTARYDRARGAIERSAKAVRALTNLLDESR